MLRKVLLSVAVTALAGCTSTIHKSALVGGVNTLSVDAKQRLAFSVQKGGPDGTHTVYCAEPSPDVFAATAASLASRVDTPNDAVSAQAAASIQEVAATIGQRSQTVQILRDGYYRLCEAYANQAIGVGEYKAALVEIDGVIVAALAIDALAGGASAGPVAIAATPQEAKVVTDADGTVTVTAGEAAASTATATNLSGSGFNAEQARAIENILVDYLNHVDARRRNLFR